MTKSATTLALIPILMISIFAFRYSHLSFSQSSAGAQTLAIPTCEPDAQGKVDQTIATTKAAGQSFDWAESTGCVTRPILETWAVTQNPDEMGVADLAKYTVAQISPPPQGSSHLYRVAYSIHNFITISWTLDWLHKIIQGTLTDPAEVDIAISKFSGTSLISHFNGTIRLLKISPSVTLVGTRFEIKTPQTDENTAAQGAEEVISRLRVGTPFWQGLSSSHLVDLE
jgi:hypothetical protein